MPHLIDLTGDTVKETVTNILYYKGLQATSAAIKRSHQRVTRDGSGGNKFHVACAVAKNLEMYSEVTRLAGDPSERPNLPQHKIEKHC